MKTGTRDYQGRIELQHVGTEVGISKALPETFEILLRGGSGKPRHEMIANLESVCTTGSGGLYDLPDPVSALHTLQDIVVQDLDAQFHTGGA